MKKFPCAIFCLLAVALITLATSCATATKEGAPDAGATHLLNGTDLKAFYTYLKSSGRNSDPDGVFTMTNGMLRISGQHTGYLATRRQHANYRLVAEFKWGDTTWAPRQFKARNSGILLNMTGEDRVWPEAIDCQLIEGGVGSLLVLDGAYLAVDGVTKGPQTDRFDRPDRGPWKDQLGFRGPSEIENPRGEWNTVEILCAGGRVSVKVNGHETLAGTDAKPGKGKILLQSDRAELFFRRLDLYPVK